MVVGADKGGKLYLVNGPAMGRVAAQRDGAAQVIPGFLGFHLNFAVWTRPDISYLYVQGSNDAPRCLQVTSAGVDSSPLSVGATLVQYSRLGMTLSADGILNGTGILGRSQATPMTRRRQARYARSTRQFDERALEQRRESRR